MAKIKTIFLVLATLNLTSILVYYLAAISELKSSKTKDFLQKDSLKKEISVPISDSVFDRRGVFDILGAYPEFKMSTYSYFPPKYETTHLGLYNDDDYCERVDAYNLAKPDNMFKNKNFFTDFGKGTLPRVSAMGKVGTIYNKDIDIWMNSVKAQQAQFHLSHEITTFYTINNMHMYHRIGKNFLCATQMYNHIPGSGFLVRKTDVLEGVVQYTKKHENQPECYNKSTYFLPAHRLYKKEECEQFFKIIHSQDYKDSLKVEPIQYLIKIGVGAHKSQGVFLLDDSQTKKLNTDFEFGKKCGQVKGTLIAQKYITNPLLLDMNNKFDFRMYMLIASSNPLIVYYHDGYLRVSVNTFDKSSKDRATHLTNTYLADQVFDKLKKTNATVHGMNVQQLKDYHLWYLKDLQNYLLKAGKITDPKWLDNYLRPAFQKAFIHLTKMVNHHFLKNSNVFELHGLDFMLDADLNLWFIEDNSNPLLIGVKPDLIATMLKDMFEVQYAYYRSRMKRILKVVNKLQDKLENQEEIDYEAFREEYQKASLNRLEPEYKISKKNTFVLVLDEGLPANKASFGRFPAKCFE